MSDEQAADAAGNPGFARLWMREVPAVSRFLLGVPRWLPWVAFALAAAAIAGASYATWRWQASDEKARVAAEIEGYTGRKVQRVADWLAERRDDAAVLARDPTIRADLSALLATRSPPPEWTLRVLHHLRAVRDVRGYEDIFLFDAEGTLRLKTGEHAQSPLAYGVAGVREAMRTGQATLIDLHLDVSRGMKTFRFALVMPLEPGSGMAAGALAFRFDPARTLYPRLLATEGPWQSAEALLARREGDEIVYLAELRHQPSPERFVRLATGEHSLLAAMAARGHRGAVEGTDYRGVAVVGATAAVPGTPWLVIGKVDAAEIYASLARQKTIGAIVAALLNAAAAIAAFLWWQALDARRVALRFREEANRLAARRHVALVAEYANDSALLTDEDGILIETNERAVQTYGYPYAELIGIDVRQLRAADVRAGWEEDTRRWTPQGVLYESRHVRRDGSEFPVEVSGRTFDVDGRRFLHAMVRDVTERKRAEAELLRAGKLADSIIASLPGMFYMMSREGRLLRGNRNLELLTGYSGDELAAMATAGFIAERDRGRARLALEAVFAAGEAQVEALVRRRDGVEVPFLFSGVRVELDGAQVALGVGFDISDRKHAEAALQALNEQLEARVSEQTAELRAANRELEAFAYTAAHDLRAPLRHVAGFIGMGIEDAGDALPPAARARLLQAADSAQRMARMIDGLLALSRVGRATLEHAPVALGALARAAVEQIAPECQGRNVEWTIGELPSVVGDASLLENLLVNLLANALKFTRGRDPVRIALECRAAAEPGMVEFCVRDNGAGFDMAHASRLFQAFQRVHRESEFEGIGIGLASCRRIVERHGGRIWAESSPGEGAAFSFTLSTP